MVAKALRLFVVRGGWVLEANRDRAGPGAPLRAEPVMLGSNSPVDRVFIGYCELSDGYQGAVASLDHAQQRAIFHETAMRVYALSNVHAKVT